MTKTEPTNILLINRGSNSDLRWIIEGGKGDEVLKLCLDLLTCHIIF
jgi:hypothetical protein